MVARVLVGVNTLGARGFSCTVSVTRANTYRPAADETKLPVVGEQTPLVPRVGSETK